MQSIITHIFQLNYNHKKKNVQVMMKGQYLFSLSSWDYEQAVSFYKKKTYMAIKSVSEWVNKNNKLDKNCVLNREENSCTPLEIENISKYKHGILACSGATRSNYLSTW